MRINAQLRELTADERVSVERLARSRAAAGRSSFRPSTPPT
jgi:hypothetical protein